MRRGWITGLLVALALGPAEAAPAPAGPAKAALRPSAAKGIVIVPDRFLRRFDPVTVFFDQDRVAGAGAEDRADRFVRIEPAHPGAFSWLDARTLQFRPADPWPALTRFKVAAGDSHVLLSTLLAPPTETVPARDAEGLEPIEQVALAFPEPLDVATLQKMIRFELRPLPGIGGAQAGEARILGVSDFQVKALERSAPDAPARYSLALNAPIPLGTRALLQIRLGLDDAAPEASAEIAFATAEPFRVLEAGCRRLKYPVTPEGSRYPKDQAIACDADAPAIQIELSARPQSLGPLEGRNLVEVEPPVEGLEFRVQGKTLEVRGTFQRDTLYRVRLGPAAIRDEKGRPLAMKGDSELYLHFPRRPSYLRLAVGQGIVERLGPKMVPVSGRGDQSLDLRVVPIAPLDRSFWPFPERPVAVDESVRPPGPGEGPTPFEEAERHIYPHELAAQLASLPSVPWSRVVRLPLHKDGGAATFGVDLAPALAYLSGKDEPGTYLVGVRRLDGSSERSWMRVQATDLALTAVDEARAVRFAVTSIATGAPIAGARVRIEGSRRFQGSPARWVTLGEGSTDASGTYAWPAPGPEKDTAKVVRRIVVEKDRDLLVLDPARAPEFFADNHWLAGDGGWLQWTGESLEGREPPAELVGHLFSERPVYRPEEKVHLRGWVRRRDKGTLHIPALDGVLVVEGPGDMVWRYPTALGPTGGFYRTFAEKDLATGTYSARFETRTGERIAGVDFRMEAYRIPDFEVRLHAPARTPLDREFEVKLTASYYAGGKVTARPVSWRVTQFPEAWTPERRPGFEYSSDARFSRGDRFQSSPRLEKEGSTGDEGSATLSLNPAIEPTASPRSYVVEATVTGADDQTVTATTRVLALPPFVLGLKVPRFVENQTSIEGEWLVAGPDGKLVAGQELKLRLIKREWHSHLRASDFSDGIGRYETDVVDTPVSEQRLSSAATPSPFRLAIPGAGVYLVELESHDRLGRAQVVTVDLFAAGAEPVSWSKPTTQVFSVATDKDSYDPGETASVVLESPFQQARALVVVEVPGGNRYEWLAVEGGTATFKLPILNTHAPRVPVHFLLERGRVAGTRPEAKGMTDLGRPQSLAATLWVKVNPLGNRLSLGLTAPEKARPGDEISIDLSLSDEHGRPLAGEVTLWLVDQAVLALGREARLDPVPDFLTEVSSRLRLRDTRNLVLGLVPFAEAPGGGEGGEGQGELLDRATVRKKFESVPYYEPAIQVGPDGKATVKVKLPDNVTIFKIRAKAASGAERFGFAVGQIAVRLPLVVQPALPRFVRPGDAFTVAAIGRVVEGEGGPGSAEARAEHVELLDPAKQSVNWQVDRAARLAWRARVESPPWTPEGVPAWDEVVFRLGIERSADRAMDATETRLPLRPDRSRIVRRELVSLVPATPVTIAALAEPARPGTVRRQLLLSSEPALVTMAAGLDYLREYPFGCTEQRLSRARGEVALKRFRALLGQRGGEQLMERAVNDTLEWLPEVIDADGLVAYWPGSRGYVSLTAWVLEFLSEARDAGFKVDAKLHSGLVATLERALRSDYGRFIDGESWMERAWALSSLARAGKFQPAYAAELARDAKFLNAEGTAEVAIAFSFSPDAGSAVVAPLARKISDAVVLRLHQGKEIYGGLQSERALSGLVLPGETRTIAEIARALKRVEPANPRLRILIDALTTQGRGDGWGSTSANAAALRALSELFEAGDGRGPERVVEVKLGDETRSLAVGGRTPVASFVSAAVGEGRIELGPGAASGPVLARVESSFLPSLPGSQVAATNTGFVVSRELFLVRPGGAPMERIVLDAPGREIALAVGDVIEEHVQVVNPGRRHYVAVVVPLAAGLEPLNPALATAPPEARAKNSLSLEPTHIAMLDDRIEYYYNQLDTGSYDFWFRTRATVEGSFVQPPATAELMYDGAVRGNSAGARVVITRPAETGP